MISVDPHPILFSIGPVAIRYYSLAYMSGFLLGYFALKKRFGKDVAEDSLLWIVLATILGGRIGEFIFYSPKTLWTNPLEILYIWHGGMSFHGALIALAVSLYLFCKKRKISFAQFADTLALPAAVALVLGRIANFLNGELMGTVTQVPWCVVFDHLSGCRHPSPLYEALYSAVIALVLVLLLRKKHPDGFVFTVFVLLYGVFRFVANFWRDDLRWLGISMGQALSLVMVGIAAYVLATKYKKHIAKWFL